MDRFLDFIDYIYWTLRDLDVRSPFITAVIIFLAIFALFKRWMLVTLILLLVVLGIGVEYFLFEYEYAESVILKICFTFYNIGGIFIVIIAVYDFFFRRKV